MGNANCFSVNDTKATTKIQNKRSGKIKTKKKLTITPLSEEPVVDQRAHDLDQINNEVEDLDFVKKANLNIMIDQKYF